MNFVGNPLIGFHKGARGTFLSYMAALEPGN